MRSPSAKAPAAVPRAGSDVHEPVETSGARQSPRSGDCGTVDVSLRLSGGSMDIRDPIEGSRRSIPRHRSLARNSWKTHASAKTRAAGGASASRGLGCARGRSPVSARSVPPVRRSAGLPRLAPIFSDMGLHALSQRRQWTGAAAWVAARRISGVWRQPSSTCSGVPLWSASIALSR